MSCVAPKCAPYVHLKKREVLMAKTEVQEEKGSKVEKHRLRGRNMFDVVNQLVTEYNASNGWSVVNVSPTLLTFEVVLERSASQANEDNTVVASKAVANKVDSKGATPDEEVEEKKATEAKDVLVEAGAEKQSTKTAKKTSATSAKKLTEAKKV